MRVITKLVAAAGLSLAALGLTAASADDDTDKRSSSYDSRGYDDDRYDDDRRGGRGYDDSRYGGRPERCDIDHDHRSHSPNYYDYWPHDDYYRGRGRGGGYDDDRYGHGRSRVIRREVFDTRYRARIYLTEEEFYTRGGRYRVCTLDVRGPEKRYVPYGRVRSLANRECSRRAEIRIH